MLSKHLLELDHVFIAVTKDEDGMTWKYFPWTYGWWFDPNTDVFSSRRVTR